MLRSQLRSGRLSLRLLRCSVASSLPKTRAAHVAAELQRAQDDPPPPTLLPLPPPPPSPAAPSPYQKEFTTELSSAAQPTEIISKRRKRKLAKLAKLEAKLQKAEAPEPGNDTAESTESSSRAVGEALPPPSDASPPRVGKGAKKKKASASSIPLQKDVSKEDTNLGSALWKEDWGEDKLKPSESSQDEPRLEVGPATPLRMVRGLIPHTKKLPVRDLSPPSEQRPVARLAHGLDRALFNPGVSWVRDPRSRVYNFTPYVEEVPDLKEFDFARVSGFIKSSRDKDLHSLAKQHGARFAGSTSSLTGMLSQIYLALSRARNVDTSVLSEAFADEPRTFSYAQTIPVSVVLWHREGVYSTDSYSHDSETSDKNILTWMGTMLEKFLTLSEDEFKPLLRSSPPITEIDDRKEAYRYAKIGSYVTRAQLDCYDPRVPGTGIFDIKTRACLPIRKDIYNWEQNSGYLIKKNHGLLESFEREYYDLICSAFLKFSFQARIGNMDGMFIAYHNTERIFGVQYVPLEEMDERLYGNPAAGPMVFDKCIQILEATMLEIVHHFPSRHIECIFEAAPKKGKLLVWASPLSWNGPKMEKPIVELSISLQNMIAGKFTDGEDVADKLPDEDWTVSYTIAQSPDSFEDIRARADKALKRQLLPWKLPQGVGVKQMAELWEAMDFGGGDLAASKAVFHPKRFRKADVRVQALRNVAQRGREETEAHDRLYAGEKKVVWGEPVEERAPAAPTGIAAAKSVWKGYQAPLLQDAQDEYQELMNQDKVWVKPDTPSEQEAVVKQAEQLWGGAEQEEWEQRRQAAAERVGEGRKLLPEEVQEVLSHAEKDRHATEATERQSSEPERPHSHVCDILTAMLQDRKRWSKNPAEAASRDSPMDAPTPTADNPSSPSEPSSTPVESTTPSDDAPPSKSE